MDQLKSKAGEENKKKKLYCTECCTKFILNSDGRWRKYGDGEPADRIKDSLFCTCGTPIAVIITEETLIGEVVPVH